MRKKLLVSALLVVAVALGTAGGLYAPPLLFPQEPPPLVGSGAMSWVQVVTSDKCSATITIDKPGLDTPKDAVINLPPGQCNKLTGEEIAQQAEDALQGLVDFCQLVSDLPDGDPDKGADPATNRLKWVIKPDAQTYLCTHVTDIDVAWTGTEYTLAWKGVRN